MVMVYKLDDKDLERFKTGLGELWVANYIAPEDKSLNAGFARYDPADKLTEWTYWYSELMYIIEGKMRYTIKSPPLFDKEEVKELDSGEMIYITKGTRVTHECISEKPVKMLYVAVPALF